MPLTAKGEKIMRAMQEHYGSEHGKSVFYASKNAGRISGVDQEPPQQQMDPTGQQGGGNPLGVLTNLARGFLAWVQQEQQEPEHQADPDLEGIDWATEDAEYQRLSAARPATPDASMLAGWLQGGQRRSTDAVTVAQPSAGIPQALATRKPTTAVTRTSVTPSRAAPPRPEERRQVSDARPRPAAMAAWLRR